MCTSSLSTLQAEQGLIIGVGRDYIGFMTLQIPPNRSDWLGHSFLPLHWLNHCTDFGMKTKNDSGRGSILCICIWHRASHPPCTHSHNNKIRVVQGFIKQRLLPLTSEKLHKWSFIFLLFWKQPSRREKVHKKQCFKRITLLQPQEWE